MALSPSLDATHLPRRFEDQVAVITGGASGIGFATAERLSLEGAKIWILDRTPGTHDFENDNIRSVQVDVTDEKSVEKVITEIAEACGRIDVLVNAAGIAAAGSVQETSVETWNNIQDVNLKGVFLVSRFVLPYMIQQNTGNIVNVSSDAGLTGMPGQAAYCASKGGVVSLTRAASLDVAPHNVRVNCVCPCFIDTPLYRAWLNDQENPREAETALAQEQPIGRIGQPGEIAAAIAFLASEEARFITGIALPVDGGVTAQ